MMQDETGLVSIKNHINSLSQVGFRHQQSKIINEGRMSDLLWFD